MSDVEQHVANGLETERQRLSVGDGERPRGKRRCSACYRCCFVCTKPCLTAQNPLPPSPAKSELCAHAIRCPPHGAIGRIFTLMAAAVFIWSVLFSLTYKQALPGGNFFGIVVLCLCAMVGGWLVGKIHLPPLLGMLLVGGLLRNVPYINVAADIDKHWAIGLRSIALVVILTRAGLGLDPAALRALSAGVLRLAALPCLVETAAAAVTTRLLLGFPWVWGIMLGFILAAVSPAVVVPSMLSLTERGFGVSKGIPTLIIAAASVDDVISISGFGVLLRNIVFTIFRGPLEALGGVVYGILVGVFIWYIPPQKDKGDRDFFRFILLFAGGIFAVCGSKVLHVPGAGALGCLVLAFVVALHLRKEVGEEDEMPMSKLFYSLWKIFQPLLFGLIGAEVEVMKIDPKTIGLGIAVLVIGLVIRMLVAFFAVFRLGLNLKEKIFVPFAWLPKATVQAAIGSIALDEARSLASDVTDRALKIELGTQVLTIAVLVILITAPIGAIAITLLGPRLLKATGRRSFGQVLPQPEELERIRKRAEEDEANAETNA